MMAGLKRKKRRDAAKARTAAVMESEAALLLMAEQGSEVTMMQGTGPARFVAHVSPFRGACIEICAV